MPSLQKARSNDAGDLELELDQLETAGSSHSNPGNATTTAQQTSEKKKTQEGNCTSQGPKQPNNKRQKSKRKKKNKKKRKHRRKKEQKETNLLPRILLLLLLLIMCTYWYFPAANMHRSTQEIKVASGAINHDTTVHYAQSHIDKYCQSNQQDTNQTAHSNRYIHKNQTALTSPLKGSLRSAPYSKYKNISENTLLDALCTINKQHPRCTGDYLNQFHIFNQHEVRLGRDLCNQNGRSPCHFYSQQREDVVLFAMFFQTLRNGVYLEMGALDGVTYSNTKFFEETLGWSGTLIEASPVSFRHLKKNRPNNRLFHNAVCSNRKKITFSGSNAEAGIRGFMSQAHIARNGFGKKTYQVQCERLSELLKGVSAIDLWSLDVEGAEYDVLQSMDWKIPVHVIIIERNANDLLIEQLLLSKGFEYVREQRGNRIWVNNHYIYQRRCR